MVNVLHLQNIVKSFGPVKALRGVSLDVYPGEVHAIIGENGAGKSTLMKVLSGVHTPDGGTMTLDGQAYSPTTPRDGLKAGIRTIYQELTLAPHLSVADNITLGIEHSRAGWIRSRNAEVRNALQLLGQTDIDPGQPSSSLSIGKQQIVEIARALVDKARIVVMDEPTSSLSASDSKALFKVIDRLRTSGVAILYISHFLEEVVEIGDRYTVLRDGKTTASGMLDGIVIDDLIPPMIGRAVEDLYPQSIRTPGEDLLFVDDVTGAGHVPAKVSFTVRRGEILGIAGLVGAGRSELLRTLFGLRPGLSGAFRVGGHHELQVSSHTSQDGLSEGLNLLSEDRKEEGLATEMSVSSNLTLSSLNRYARAGVLDLTAERTEADRWIGKLSIKCSSPDEAVSNLSGGNQQKICLARLLHDDSDVLLLDEPTRGIDIGSKTELYRLIDVAARDGKAVVIVSSYLPELFGMCDSLAVMYRGGLSPVCPIADWTDESVLRFATTGSTG